MKERISREKGESLGKREKEKCEMRGEGCVLAYILACGNRLPRAGNRLPILVIDYRRPRTGN